MEAKIQKQLIDYFSFFDEFETTARTNLRDCQSCAASINKLIKRCKSIKEADVTGTPLQIFSGLQSKLCATAYNLISKSIEDIRCKQAALEESFEQLSNKNKALRETCREANLDEKSALVKGTPIQPSLETLLEFADDTITFASQACAQIDSALNILGHRKLDTVALSDHFWYPVRWNKRIAEIITYTSFLSETQA